MYAKACIRFFAPWSHGWCRAAEFFARSGTAFSRGGAERSQCAMRLRVKGGAEGFRMSFDIFAACEHLPHCLQLRALQALRDLPEASRRERCVQKEA